MYAPRRSNEFPASPPLHHPVPQHPIPPFRSPPPQQAKPAGNPYVPQSNQQQQHQSGQWHQQVPEQRQQSQQQASTFGYANIFNDPSAQIGIEVGRNALNYGQQYIGKNINQYLSMPVLKYYFQVSNSYVLHKILLVLFPWRHKPWSRQLQRSETTGQVIDHYATARDDINAPDMYIPVMGFTTYVLLTSVVAGLQGSFHPKILGYVASKSIAFMLTELILLKIGTYLLSAGSKLLDFIAYSGYKFIGVTLTMLVSAIFGGSFSKWAVFLYTAAANAFFLLRSLRYVLLPDNSSAVQAQAHTISSGQRQRRIQFLFFYSFVCQFFLMWVLIL